MALHQIADEGRVNRLADQPGQAVGQRWIGRRLGNGGALDGHGVVAQKVGRHCPAEPGQGSVDRGVAVEMSVQGLEEPFGVVLDDGLEESRLVAEPGIQGFLGGRRAPCHLEHGGVAIAALGEQVECDIKDLCPPCPTRGTAWLWTLGRSAFHWQSYMSRGR